MKGFYEVFIDTVKRDYNENPQQLNYNSNLLFYTLIPLYFSHSGLISCSNSLFFVTPIVNVWSG